MTPHRRVDSADEPTTARQAAAMAAEAVRALNHLTMRPPDLTDLYAVIGELRMLTERLPQALDQLATVLERPTLGLEFGTDDGDDPATVIGAAVIALRTATGDAHDAARRLADAHNAAGHLCIARELAVVEVEPGNDPHAYAGYLCDDGITRNGGIYFSGPILGRPRSLGRRHPG